MIDVVKCDEQVKSEDGTMRPYWLPIDEVVRIEEAVKTDAKIVDCLPATGCFAPNGTTNKLSR